MNPKFDSYLRHLFTAWITAAVLYLATLFALDEKSAAALVDGFSRIADGVLILLAVLVPAAGRLLWAWAANTFRREGGNERTDDNDERGGGSGGISLLLVTGAAVGILGSLPSCSAAFAETQDFKTQDARKEFAEQRPGLVAEILSEM
jgi:hypothetical protein